MSLILEALKKSEQQRRLGEAPTLGSPVVATRQRRSVLPVLAVLIAFAAGAGWWLTRKPPEPLPAAPAAAVTADKTAPAAKGAKPGDSTAAANATMQDRLKQEAARRKVEQARRADAVGGAKPNAPLGLPNANPAVSAAPRKPGDPMPHAMLQPKTPADAATPNANPAKTDGAGVPPKAATTPPPPAAAPAKETAAAPAPAKTPAAAAPEGNTLPTIWELPFATRKDIPALDLSMHVYSSDPQQRFVVIKGERHVEGDEIASDLTLREIRQDGLVLEYKGQKFFFPRNGR